MKETREQRLQPVYLDFQMPAFTRLLWVGDAARRTWEGRLDSIRQAWHQVEELSVVEGLRSAASVVVPSGDLVDRAAEWSRRGLSSLPVDSVCREDGAPLAFQVVVGSARSCGAFREASHEDDHAAMGRLLGYPACCTAFYGSQSRKRPGGDLTWTIAARTAGRRNADHTVAIPAEGALNLLWYPLSLRLTPHLPCRYTCTESRRSAARFAGLAKDQGFRREVGWLSEIFSWPVEWSGLHGIAEIRTPILKAALATDPTGPKYAIRFQGSAYPAEGARGLAFPYRPAAAR
jgi:hypothetical protein